ncbi:sigma-70 family RNA polymerase sigma factor [Kitasatospora sp. NPDC054939]
MPRPPQQAADAPDPTLGQGADEGLRPSPAGSDCDSDAALIARLRAGDADVVGTLYERHHRAALGYARSLGGMDHRAEDLASEAFVRTLAAVRAGNGPTDYWRPYLLTVVRNTAAAWAANERRSFPTDDVEDWTDEADHAFSPDQIVAASAEYTLVVRAYRSLPERWQSVLWHSVVERRPTEEVAHLLGLSTSGVSSLAARAREGLRTAYLAAHLSGVQSAECQAYAGRLTAQARGTAQRRSKALSRHLDECPDCRRCDEELRDVNRRLRLAVVAFVGPWPGDGTSASAFTAHVGSGPLTTTPPPHAPPPSGPPAGLSKAATGVLTAGTALVAAVAVTSFLMSPPPKQPGKPQPPGPVSTPADGAPDRPTTAVPTLPTAPSPTPNPTTATGIPGAPEASIRSTPPGPTRPASQPTTVAPSPRKATGPSGGLSAGVQSASTPAAALPGDRRVRLRLVGSGNCGEIEDRESTAGTPYFVPCTASDDQSWIVRTDRSGGVRLINAANSGCLESAGTAGAVVTQQACGETTGQSWQVVDLADGGSTLRHRASGLILASQGTGQVNDILQLRPAACAADPVCRPAVAFRL